MSHQGQTSGSQSTPSFERRSVASPMITLVLLMLHQGTKQLQKYPQLSIDQHSTNHGRAKMMVYPPSFPSDPCFQGR